MSKILICVDGSPYADKICKVATWAAKRLNAGVDILHVLRRESSYQDPSSDHTGSLGLEDRTKLMEELAKVDEERGRLDQQKGRLILEHAEKLLRASGVANPNTIYRRGSLSETIKELEHEYDIIFVGKHGEQANLNSEFLGSNLEKVARIVSKPLFTVSTSVPSISSFVLAFDGKDSAKKAVQFASSSRLLVGLKCHLLVVESQAGGINLSSAEETLRGAGLSLVVKRIIGKDAFGAITSYVKESGADLLLTGAYGHSRLRTMLLGSTTENLLKSCDVPVLLFR